MSALETLAAVRDRRGTEPEPWPDPMPLPAGLPAVPGFDLDLLPRAFKPWIGDITDRLQCPADFPAVAAVIALAAVVGRQIAIRPKKHDDWTVVPNLWGAIIGRPGLLKTPALAEPLKPVQRLDIRAREAHEAALAEWEAGDMVRAAERELAKKEIAKAVKERRDATGIARGLQGEGEEPQRRRYLLNDTTVEKVGEILSANPRGVLISRDELTGFLRDLDREGREGARAFYLEAWNGTGRFTYDRIGRGTVEIEAACVSLLGGIQPGPLSAYLSGALKGGTQDDGLLQRFQIIVWPDAPQEWRNIDRWPNSAARDAVWSVFDWLDNLDPTKLGATQETGELPYLRFSNAAQAAFDEWRAGLEMRLRTDDLPPAFEAHLAKYRSLVPSLALLTHLADAPQGGPVSEEAFVAAAAWAEYLEGHAQRLYSPALTPGLVAARELHRRILAGQVGTDFAARDVYRNHWRLLDRESTDAALKVLADFDHVRAEQVETTGRYATTWHVNPKLFGGQP